jgi:hypothetical protein
VAVHEPAQRREATSTQSQRLTAPIRAARLIGGAGELANAATPVTAAAATTTAGSSAATRARTKARRGGHPAQAPKVRNDKAANASAVAPGQLKAPRTPAQGKPHGAGKVKARGAKPARVKLARRNDKAAPLQPKTLTGKAPKPPKLPKPPTAASAAAQTAPGQSAAGPPGQMKQLDPGAKKP